jgi:hypothetical protein
MLKDLLRAIAVPSGIWALRFVSSLMDRSSAMTHALGTVCLVAVHRASITTTGNIDCVADATASVTKVLSAILSEGLGTRMLLAVIGWSLPSLTKAVTPVAQSADWLVEAWCAVRIGKEIREGLHYGLSANLVKP